MILSIVAGSTWRGSVEGGSAALMERVQQCRPALATHDQKPDVAPHYRDEQRCRARRLLASSLECPSESGGIPLRRLAQHRHEPSDIGPVAPDRLIGGAAMLLEPCQISRHVRVIVRHRFDRWDDTAASQKLDEVPSASPPPLRARGDQLASLAPDRTSTIMRAYWSMIVSSISAHRRRAMRSQAAKCSASDR
jgi:hypothetical protein